jgi:hypothetical protein
MGILTRMEPSTSPLCSAKMKENHLGYTIANSGIGGWTRCSAGADTLFHTGKMALNFENTRKDALAISYGTLGRHHSD